MKNRIKFIKIITLLLLFPFGYKAQIKTFIKTIHEDGAQQFFDAERTYDNGIIIIGQAGEGYCGDGLLTKIDSCGELSWAKKFGEVGKYTDGGRVVKELPNHNILLGGFVVQGTSKLGALKMADEFGNQIWSVEFPALRFITGVNRTSTGDILICGYTHDEQCSYAKLDGNGNVLWKKKMNIPSPSKRAYDILELNNGNYVLIWNSIAPKADVYVSLLNPLGEVQWTKSYGSGSTFPILREWEPSATIDPSDGNVVVCTATTSLGNGTETAPDILVFKISPDGSVLWSKTYGDASDDQPKKISYDVQTGGFVVSGKTDYDVSSAPTTETMLGHNALVLYLDNTGAVIRSNIYGGSGEDKAVETVSYAHHYITTMVCLNSLGSAGYDPFLIKTNENGEVACQFTSGNFSASFAVLGATAHNFVEVNHAMPSSLTGTGFSDNNTEFSIFCQSCDPYFEMIGDPTICIEDSIVLVKKDGCSSFFTINGQVENSDTVVFHYNEGGHYTITLEHNCVEQPYLFDVYVAVPSAEYTWENKCLYDSIPFLDQSITNYGTIAQWDWNFGENGAVSSLQNPKHKYLQDGLHTVKLKVTTSDGCIDSIEHNVTAHPVPEAILLTKNECLYDSVVFIDSTQINPPSNVSSYYVNFGDGSPTVYEQSPKHKYPSEGTYNISYITVSNEGCIDDTAITVEVYPVPVASFSNTTICENEPPTEFLNLSTVNGDAITQWQWYFDEDENEVDTLPNPAHFYKENGVYNVKMIVKTNHNCFDTIIRTVTVLAKPVNLFISDITESCSPTCVNFMDYTQPNSSSIISWYWNFGDGEESIQQNPSKCFTNSSNTIDSAFTVSLITINDLGCSDSLRVENYIWSRHNPIAEFEPAPNLTNMYLSEIDFMNSSTGAEFYSWNFGDEAYSIDFEPTHRYGDTGTYVVQLAVETDHACYDTTYRTVRIDPFISIFTPNSFTPNGDGVNDEFFFKSYGIEEEGLEFYIFDRWGTLIYFTNQFKPWDGTYRGQDVQQDTYIYKIKCIDFFGEEREFTGHVNVLR